LTLPEIIAVNRLAKSLVPSASIEVSSNSPARSNTFFAHSVVFLIVYYVHSCVKTISSSVNIFEYLLKRLQCIGCQTLEQFCCYQFRLRTADGFIEIYLHLVMQIRQLQNNAAQRAKEYLW
jgi:hypothetical protein